LQIIDFLTYDFHICPHKHNVATKPDSVLAPAHARSLGLLGEVRGFAAALLEVTEH